MALYSVLIQRTEEIALVLEASGPEDAEQRALMDGMEYEAETRGVVYLEVELCQAEQLPEPARSTVMRLSP